MTDHLIQRRVHDILLDSGITYQDTTLQIVVDNTTLAENDLILDLWTEKSTWIYVQSDLQHYLKDGVELPGGYIFTQWTNWIERNGDNLLRSLDALFSDYDPIANYDMQEAGSDGDKEDKTHTTPKGKTHTDITPYATGINSTGDGAKQGKQMSETYFSDQAESELSHDHNKNITDNAGSSVSGYWKTHDHYFRRHGNIGVTSTAQLIGGEIELRTVDLISDFVDRFFARYCYYVGGDR